MYKVNLSQKQLDRWIRALRSGAYRQGRNYLVNMHYTGTDFDNVSYRVTSFCCMGVLGKICGLSLDEMDQNVFLSHLGRRELLRPFDDGQVDSTALVRKLAIMNDTGKTFRQIATWIRRNVKAK